MVRSGSASSTVTGTPRRARLSAVMRPTGPAPAMRTREPSAMTGHAIPTRPAVPGRAARGAGPRRLGREARDRFLLERQAHRAVALGREVGGVRHFHDLASLLGGDEHGPVEGHRLDEVDGLRLHRTLVDVAD